MRAPAWLRRAALRAIGVGEVRSWGAGELLAVAPTFAPPAMAFAGEDYAETSEDRHPFSLVDGIAEFRVTGFLSKDRTFARLIGLSCQQTTTEMAAMVRAAAASDEVRGGIMYVDSEGGQVRGMSELLAAFAEFRAKKPLHAYAEMALSGGYWFAAQAQRLTVSLLSDVGSIGALSKLVDASKAGEMAGIKVHLVRTGPVKGMGVEPLAGVSEEEVAALQKRVEDILGFFLPAVAAGRGIDVERVRELATGATYSSTDAVANGLADAVGTYGEAIASLQAAVAAASPPMAAPAAEPQSETSEELEPAPLLSAAPEEEPMSKPNADAAASPEFTGEERGILRRLLGAFATKPEGAAAAAQPAQPAGLTPEEVDQRVAAGVAARFNEQEVDRDLQALAARVPPAVLANPEIRAMLLEAKAKGPEAYRKRLEIVAGNEAGALLGGPVAGEQQTTAGRTGLTVNATDLAWLEAHGCDAKAIAGLEGKYGPLGIPRIAAEATNPAQQGN